MGWLDLCFQKGAAQHQRAFVIAIILERDGHRVYFVSADQL